jgi:hypothetical protein
MAIRILLSVLIPIRPGSESDPEFDTCYKFVYFYSFYLMQCQLRLFHLSCQRVIGDKIFNILDSTGPVLSYMIFWKKVKFTFTFG